MLRINFTAWFGDEQKAVEISEVAGADAETYFVFVDKYYKGAFIRSTSGVLCYSSTAPISFTGDDIQVLIDIIEKNRKIR